MMKDNLVSAPVSLHAGAAVKHVPIRRRRCPDRRNIVRITIASSAAMVLSTLLVSAPAVAQQSAYADIAQGENSTCAISERDGGVSCDLPFFLERLTPPFDLPPMAQLASGDSHVCGIDTSGAIRCWGDDDFGQQASPTSSAPFVDIAASFNHSCAVDALGAAFCWGENSSGKTDVPMSTSSYVAIDGGLEQSCAVLASGEIHCWGRNSVGQLNVPADPAGYRDVATAGRSACGLNNNGNVRCWGDALDAPSGVPNDLERNGIYDSMDMSASFRGPAIICGLANTSRVRLDCSFGFDSGAAADYRTIRRSIMAGERTPVKVSLAPSSASGCVLFADGSIDCFGRRALDADSVLLGGDRQTGRPPSRLGTVIYSDTAIALTWVSEMSPRNRGEGFEITRNGEVLAFTRNGSSFVDDTLEPGIEYTYTIAYVRGDGTRLEAAESVSVTTGSVAPDPVGPTPEGGVLDLPERTLEVAGLEARVYSDTTLELLWARPEARFRAFEVRRDGEFLGFTRGTNYLDTGVAPGNRYRYDVIGIALDGRIDGISSVEQIVGSDEVCYVTD